MKKYLKFLSIFALLFFNMKVLSQGIEYNGFWGSYFSDLVHPITWEGNMGIVHEDDWCSGSSGNGNGNGNGNGGPGSCTNGPFGLSMSRNYKLMTYNIHRNEETTYYQNGVVIKNSGADVVAVQEIGFPSVNFPLLKSGAEMNGVFLATLDYFFYKYGIGLMWKPSLGWPNGIVTGIVKDLYGDKDGKRGFIIAIWDDFIFVSTHYPTSGGFNNGENNKNAVTYEIFKKSIMKYRPIPAFIAGDLNCQPQSAPIAIIKSYCFEVLNNLEKYSDGTYKHVTSNNKMIDLIIGDKKFPNAYQVILREIPTVAKPIKTYSDHLPYLVEIE